MNARLTRAREAWDTALARMQTAAEAIQNAAADTPEEELRALEQAFDEATAETTRCEAAYAREEKIAHARAGLVAFRRELEVTREPLTYEPHAQHSFFRDQYHAQHGDLDAAGRLQRHMQEMRVEKRDLSSTDGQGGNFVAPLYLQDDWIALARAGRPYANAVRRLALPPNTDSINIPKVTGGTATATQSDNAAVQQTDMTDALVTVPVRTIAGQQDVSRQLFERSLPGIDQVLFMDLTADYATKLDVQTLNGNGNAPNAKGVLQDSNAIAVSYTDATPTPGELYAKIADAIQQVSTNRFLTPTAVVLHPRRWSWFLAALDNSGRPLVLPNAQAVNPLALVEAVGAENVVGNLLGLPVIIDASIPTNGGVGNNQDSVIVTRLDDAWLFETDAPRTRVFEDVKSGTLEIRVQIYGYFAYSSERYSKAHAVITGTGLTTPTF
jgi:HK97 family phage major capsid protein